MQDQRQLPYSDILYRNTSHVQDYIRIDIGCKNLCNFTRFKMNGKTIHVTTESNFNVLPKKCNDITFLVDNMSIGFLVIS